MVAVRRWVLLLFPHESSTHQPPAQDLLTCRPCGPPTINALKAVGSVSEKTLLTAG